MGTSRAMAPQFPTCISRPALRVISVPSIETRTSLPPEVSSAAEARRFVRKALGESGLSGSEEVAMPAASELVTNAVLPARSVFELVLQTRADEVRVEVHDSSPVLPTRKHYGVDAGTGPGIMLVDALAEGWGGEPTGSGKVVWFETRAAEDAAPLAFELAAETLADLEA